MTSHNFLILSDKSRPVLDLICNRFAAELNEISVSQEEFGDQKLTKEDPAFRYGHCSSDVKRDCVFRVAFGSSNANGINRASFLWVIFPPK